MHLKLILAQFAADPLFPRWPLGHKRTVSSAQVAARNGVNQGPGSPQVSRCPQNYWARGRGCYTHGVPALLLAE